MAMRRRGGGGRGRGSARLVERLREARGLALRDLAAIERVPGAPDRIDLGSARTLEGDASVAIAAGARDLGDLCGWGALGAFLQGGPDEAPEIRVVAPAFVHETQRAAALLAERGASLRLIAVPGLASGDLDVHADEPVPYSATAEPGEALLGRLARVLDGAAALTGPGVLRAVPGGHVLYLRGRAVMGVSVEGDGIGVTLLGSQKREIHVSDAGFARWGLELHEMVAELARDPRLLDDWDMQREQLAGGAAAQVGVRVRARWLPCAGDIPDAVDWVGQDRDGRPVLGAVRRAVALADVPGLLAAVFRFEDEREVWAPASVGAPRLFLTSDAIDARAIEALRSVRLEVSGAGIEEAVEAAGPLEAPQGRDRGGRRPRRRRRRGRGDERDAQDLGGGARQGDDSPQGASREDDRREESLSAPEAEAPAAERSRGRPPRGRDRRPRPAPEPLSAFPGEGDAEDRAEPERDVPTPTERDARMEGDAPETGADVAPQDESALERADLEPRERERDDERSEPTPGGDDGPLVAGDEPPDGVELEIEATLAEEPEEESAESGPVEEPIARRRRPRAAIVVRDDPDSVLAALVLARERRSVVSFVVCRQDDLMDYFRTRATDVGENVDLLLVGFTAQPIPSEVIQAAGLYRGRLDWFDHHDWPIEDLEMLRETIGRESIVFAEGAWSPLGAVMETAERRSRFTDKLVDLSGRRLGEGDMEKWGLRVVGLIQRLASTPGEHRQEIVPVLSGKPGELPEAEGVFAEEAAWVEAQPPRLVYFGEYQMAVVHVPENLDAGEVARRMRVRTDARLSMATRAGDDVIQISCNEEKRHVNVLGVTEQLAGRIPWAEARPGGDRTARLWIDDLSRHPERAEIVLAEIVRHKSILYG